MCEKIYNEEIKNRFVEEKCANLETRKNYKSLFLKTNQMEKFYDKDLYMFNMEQLIDTFKSLDRLTLNSLTKDLSIINLYITWAIQEGYTTTIVNYTDLITKEDLKKCVNAMGKESMYVKNRDELYELVDLCNNYQDKILPVLLYEGVRGRAERENAFEEIINLKESDCDFTNNTITVTRNNGETRLITDVDERSMDIIKRASEETHYLLRNGESKGKVGQVPLMETEYVVKTVRRSTSGLQVKVTLMNGRFKDIQTYIDRPHITPITVFHSGQLEKCVKLENEKGELNTNDYMDVYKSCGIIPQNANWYNLKELYESYKEVGV